jgi:hypothetical protein
MARVSSSFGRVNEQSQDILQNASNENRGFSNFSKVAMFGEAEGENRLWREGFTIHLWGRKRIPIPPLF